MDDGSNQVGNGFADQGAEAEQPAQQVQWQASEFIEQAKTSAWYLGFFLVSIAVLGGLFFIGRDLVSVFVVALLIGFVFYFSHRTPRMIMYSVDDSGITVAQRHYGYEEFRSFAVIKEGGILSISLHPLQRFALPLSIYFDPQQSDQIIDVLSYYLPKEASTLSLIDHWSRKLRL